jgi:hypothetical protein
VNFIDTHPQSWLLRIRAWLRSDLRVLRWVFLSLYLLLLFGLILYSVTEFNSSGLGLLICLAVMFIAQAMFIFGAGTIQLCRPIKRRRLLLPVVAAAFMLTVLMAGLAIALLELLKYDNNISAWAFWGMFAFSWIFWGILLFAYAKRWQRFSVLSRVSRYIFVGSLAELLGTIPSHLIIIRRPGCLVGIASMLGIIAGIGVMIFSFGPMIVVLFLRPMYRAEKEREPYCCANCGYDLRASTDRCPECGQAFVRTDAMPELDPRQA